MFGHASMPTHKWNYGLRKYDPNLTRPDGESRPTWVGQDRAIAQLYGAHLFQNELVKLERTRRENVEAVLRELHPDVAETHAAAESQRVVVAELRDQLTAANVQNQKTASDKGLIREVNVEKKALAELWKRHKAARAVAFGDTEVKKRLKLIDTAHDEAVKALRTRFVGEGLYWPTTLQVVQRVKRSGPPPKFKSWDGSGVISIQFQRKADKDSEKVPVMDAAGKQRIHPRSKKPMFSHVGGKSMTTTDIFKENSMFWIERHRKMAPLKPYKKKTNCTLHFRVGSRPDGSPLWAHLPLTLHREMPEDGEIKWAHLSRRRLGYQYKWEVQFDIARKSWHEHPLDKEGKRATEGTVAVALGWRYIDGCVRAAEWVGDDGVTNSILIGADVVERWRGLEGLQSVRDKLFDEMKAALLEWLRGREGELPDEWKRETETLHAWNSPRRLARLVWWWGDHRLEGDQEIFTRMEGQLVTGADGKRFYTGGRKQDKHLADWQAFSRYGLMAYRKDLYRGLAIDLAQQYKCVVVAEIDWAEIAKNPDPEDAEEHVSKTLRGIAACATFRDCATHYMDEIKVDAAGITVTCAKCGATMADPKAGRWVRCEVCGGEKVDRAVNAAKNLLQRALEENVEV